MTQITGFELLLRRWVRNSSADLEANPTTQSQGTVGIDAHRRASHIEPFLFIKVREILDLTLTDGIFETGAYGVPSKSQNPTVLGQGGPSSTQYSNPSWACCWHHRFGTINYPPFRYSTKNQAFIPALDFLFFTKIRFEITNI